MLFFLSKYFGSNLCSLSVAKSWLYDISRSFCTSTIPGDARVVDFFKACEWKRKMETESLSAYGYTKPWLCPVPAGRKNARGCYRYLSALL
jgi:hypothetical protein